MGMTNMNNITRAVEDVLSGERWMTCRTEFELTPPTHKNLNIHPLLSVSNKTVKRDEIYECTGSKGVRKAEEMAQTYRDASKPNFRSELAAKFVKITELRYTFNGR